MRLKFTNGDSKNSPSQHVSFSYFRYDFDGFLFTSSTSSALSVPILPTQEHHHSGLSPRWHHPRMVFRHHLHETFESMTRMHRAASIPLEGLPENRTTDLARLSWYVCIDVQIENHWRNTNYLVVSNIFCVHPYLGKWSNLTSIFLRWVETTN